MRPLPLTLYLLSLVASQGAFGGDLSDDPFFIIGVPPGSSAEVIKAAYSKKLKELSTAENVTSASINRVIDAFEEISSPTIEIHASIFQDLFDFLGLFNVERTKVVYQLWQRLSFSEKVDLVLSTPMVGSTGDPSIEQVFGGSGERELRALLVFLLLGATPEVERAVPYVWLRGWRYADVARDVAFTEWSVDSREIYDVLREAYRNDPDGLLALFSDSFRQIHTVISDQDFGLRAAYHLASFMLEFAPESKKSFGVLRKLRTSFSFWNMSSSHFAEIYGVLPMLVQMLIYLRHVNTIPLIERARFECGLFVGWGKTLREIEEMAAKEKSRESHLKRE